LEELGFFQALGHSDRFQVPGAQSLLYDPKIFIVLNNRLSMFETIKQDS
jgi:hypothetical protein